ncbi:MAG TPA: ABC transporter permease, partial [Arenibaculum sp.]|nr:ABC transporter permease [Arenibaculum sp.]
MSTTADTVRATGATLRRARWASLLQRHGVLLALAALILFGALRYENFLGAYNVLEVLRYNSMFGLIAVGMCFVIMTGGIDLSVGAVAALASVVAALLSPQGLAPALVAGTLAGTAVGLLNGVIVTRLHVLPFIATLATLLGARGVALLLAGNQSVSVSWETAFVELGQG